MRRDYVVRWCEWWYAERWNTRSGLKPKSTTYPDHGHHGNLPARKNSHGRTGNQIRNLMISSQRPWPLDHEAGLNAEVNLVNKSSQLRLTLTNIKHSLVHDDLQKDGQKLPKAFDLRHAFNNRYFHSPSTFSVWQTWIYFTTVTERTKLH